jgi:hypothetical protein
MVPVCGVQSYCAIRAAFIGGKYSTDIGLASCGAPPLLGRPAFPQEPDDIETVEAEVVYLIRAAGQWPAFQTEIHFHPSSPRHRELAEEIMSHYRIHSASGLLIPLHLFSKITGLLTLVAVRTPP